MISPKFILLGLSGSGIVAGGLAAWRLTKRTNTPTLTHIPKFTLSDEQESQGSREIREKCGEDIWTGNDDNDDQENSKGISYQKYDNCRSGVGAKTLNTTPQVLNR